MKIDLKTLAAMAIFLLVAATQSKAVTVPFNEEFAVSTVNWKDAASLDLTHVSSGGPDGGAYVSTEFAFTSAPTGSSALFRGHDNFNSSSDALVGNWLANGIGTLSAYVRHDAPQSVSYFARFATSANFPGAVVELPGAVAPNTWTRLDFDVRSSNPLLTVEGPPSGYGAIFSSLGNVQISARVPDGLGQDSTPYTFDLDKVSIAPEPASISMILAASALGLLMRRAHRGR